MTILNYIIGVLAALILLGTVIEMLRRGRLRERHALWWLVLGVIALFLALFPQVTVFMAHSLGVEVPLNLLLFLGLLVMFLVNMQQASEMTKLEDRTRELAEHVALLEYRVQGGATGAARGERGFGAARGARETDGASARESVQAPVTSGGAQAPAMRAAAQAPVAPQPTPPAPVERSAASNPQVPTGPHAE